jgi:hypothetical protein
MGSSWKNFIESILEFLWIWFILCLCLSHPMTPVLKDSKRWIQMLKQEQRSPFSKKQVSSQ